MEIINRLIIKQAFIFAFGSSQSLRVSAYKYFLTVDPIFHTTKSSGQIISKVDRSANNVDDLINLLLSGILPVVTKFVTVVIAISTFDISLAIVSISSFILILAISYIATNINLKSFYKEVIKRADKLSTVAVENLHQNSLIRSSFATNSQYIKTAQLALTSTVSRVNFTFTNGLITTVIRLIYVISVTVILLIIFNYVISDKINSSLGISLVITYINGSSQILRLGQTIQNFSEKHAGIVDLFTFIRGFGRQTYPVLEGDEVKFS